MSAVIRCCVFYGEVIELVKSSITFPPPVHQDDLSVANVVVVLQLLELEGVRDTDLELYAHRVSLIEFYHNRIVCSFVFSVFVLDQGASFGIADYLDIRVIASDFHHITEALFL